MHEDQRSLVGSEFIPLCLGKTFDYEGLVRAAACARGVSVVVTDGHVALPACERLCLPFESTRFLSKNFDRGPW